MSNDKKPDFSNVSSGVTSTEQAAPPKPDFSNVTSGVTSTEDAIGGQGRSYTIEKGDTLSGIAKRFYGKAKYWRQIHEANSAAIDNPDRIFPGQVITLPAIDVDGDGTPDDPADA